MLQDLYLTAGNPYKCEDIENSHLQHSNVTILTYTVWKGHNLSL